MLDPSAMPPVPEAVPDSEDDPGKLLTEWLGELNSLKKGLDPSSTKDESEALSSVECSPSAHIPNGVSSSAPLPPVLRRRNNTKPEAKHNVQFRRSLINIDDATQDDELDAILGELSVLGSQLESEIDQKLTAASAASAATERDGSSDDSSGVHSRSSSGESGQVVKSGRATTNGKRTDSPDNDSAFCDNLSVLSSCSASSSSKLASSSGVSSSTSPSTSVPPPASAASEEAKAKAEKIKLAIEKIKEANVKKIFVKVFAADGSAKSLLVDEKMTVGHVTRILADKNHIKLDPKWAIVELIPELYMERVYEDHENLVENCLMWKVDSKNTLWFIERPEKFDLFLRPEMYLLGSSSSQKGDLMEEHSRQELLEEYFSSSGVGAPEGVEGFIYLKSESKKSWKKFYFVLRSSGMYYAPKGKKTSKDLVCLATFDVNQVYYGSNWRKKYKSPTDFGFAVKHPQIQAKSPKTRHLCVETEKEMHMWVTAIRIAKNGRQLFDNYRGIEEEITHADIDILTSKRFSLNSPSGKQPQPQQASSSPVTTPSSENKSFDSALSSGGNVDEEDTTPVNTMSRLSKSSASSSSGCLSDKSSGSGQPFVPNGLGGGFDSDFPVGGTIKKRPAAAATPRIPLTNTTWGLVSKDSDEDSESASGDSTSNSNVRIGGGGTLLRSAVRHSLRKTSIHRAQVHAEEADPMSQRFKTAMATSITDELPLPPPPRADAVDAQDVDDLPPPPPPDVCDQMQRMPKPKRISFDDNVQMIPDPDTEQHPAERFFFQRDVYCTSPKKLTGEKGPAKDFLKDLQRVMTKKWQVAEKCKEQQQPNGHHVSPHQVLGFRDPEFLGVERSYSRDPVGAWVLQTQQYAESRRHQPNHVTNNHVNHQQMLNGSGMPPHHPMAVGQRNLPPPPVRSNAPPVVLREPECGRVVFANGQQNIYQEVNGVYGGTQKSIPPPPPRRSENTHLTLK